MKVYAEAGVCSGSAVAVSLNEDRSAGRNSASYWVHRASHLAMPWATINRGHCPYLRPLMQYISWWLFSVFGCTLIFFYLLHFIFISSFCRKKMTVPKWRSHFHIGNSKMVLLHVQVKVECLAQLFSLVPSHCLIACHSLPTTFLCSSLSLEYVLLLCPPDFPSKSNVPLPLLHLQTLVLWLVSSNPQAVVLTSAPWTSPYLHSGTWPVGFLQDRDIFLFTFASVPPARPRHRAGIQEILVKLNWT